MRPVLRCVFLNGDQFLFFLEQLGRDANLILLHREIHRIYVELRYFRFPVMSDDRPDMAMTSDMTGS